MRHNFYILVLFFFSIEGFGQGGYAFPGNYDFKTFTDDSKAYNYSGIDIFLGRNISSNTKRNFVFLKNAVNNWSFVKLSEKLNLYTQIQRTDEFYLKDPGLTNGIVNSLSVGFEWHPDTILDLSRSRVGIIGYQDFGSWAEWESQSGFSLFGMRLRDYTNIYALDFDTASLSNSYTSQLNTGSEYVAFAQGNQIYLSGNVPSLELIQSDPLKFVSSAIAPKNYLLLFDYIERHKINDQHEFETSFIGIPIYSQLTELVRQTIQLDWSFSGLKLSKLDSILPRLNVQKDTNIAGVTSQLNSKSNIFNPAQEVHFGWTYTPRPSLRYTAKISLFSNHLFNNSNLSLGMYQNHGKNLQVFTRLNFSSQFGNWNEVGLLFKPFPGMTIFSNLSGTDIFRYRETLQVKKDFKILHLSFGLFANL